MTPSRLSFALEQGGLSLPVEGTLAVIGPPVAHDLSALPRDRVGIVHHGASETAYWRSMGFACAGQMPDDAAAAILCLPRARDLAQGWLAAACARAALVVVDGSKTDGVEAVLKSVRARVPILGQVSKAHGKCFWLAGTDRFADWADPGPQRGAHGFVTAPGVFSADGPDPASELLAQALPARLGAQVADLGAGWGYLSTRILERPGIAALHLVENDRTALDCARANVTDPRAAFHWADALHWHPPAPLDAVVMNPPFHAGRRADPALGRAFIAAAAGMLAPSGRLWLVANRHLPYEAALSERFAVTEESAGDARFKILHAARPARARR